MDRFYIGEPLAYSTPADISDTCFDEYYFRYFSLTGGR